jgi:hypothetical protein
MITNLRAPRKMLEGEKNIKRGVFSTAKKDLKKIRSKKSKADKPAPSEIQNILEKMTSHLPLITEVT